jgi:hypothetical protein
MFLKEKGRKYKEKYRKVEGKINSSGKNLMMKTLIRRNKLDE